MFNISNKLTFFEILIIKIYIFINSILKIMIDGFCHILILPDYFRKQKIINGDVKRILIMNLCGIGDILALTPLIESIKESGNYEIFLLSAGPTKAIFKNDVSVNIIEFKYGFRYLLYNLKIINSYNFDLIYNYFREEYNGLIVCLSNAKYKCGYLFSNKISSNNIFIKNIDSLYQCKFFESYDIRKCALNLAKILELKHIKNNGDYKIIQNNTIFNIDEFTNNKKFDKIITIFIDNQWHARSWDVTNWIKLINNLLDKNLILVLGQNNNKTVHKIFFAGIKKHENLINCIDKYSVLETSQLLSLSDVFVTTDSGPLHIGFTSKVKNIIGLFGPTNPNCVFLQKKGYLYFYDENFKPKVSHYSIPISNKSININFEKILDIINSF